MYQLFTLSSPEIFDCPIVEFLTFSALPPVFLPSSLNPMITFISKTAGCIDATSVVTNDAKTKGEEGFRDQFLVIVGWESIAANEKAANSDGFRSLAKADGIKVAMHH